MISSWISEDKKPRLTERNLHLICECTRSVSSSNSIGTSILSKFENSSLPIRSSRLNNDILWVFNCNNNTSSELKLFPCFSEIYNINPIVAALEDVSFHLKVAVFSTEMDIGGKHHLGISFFLRELTRGSHGGGSSRVWLRLGL
uniref:Uncharacterized protein n=1 Tax=Medicago truncatula TaxID=3880 RepID=I3SF78_MEDTR|nr:unknown [Medicago truncatula]